MKGYIAVLLCIASISMVIAQKTEQCGVNEEPSNCKNCMLTCANYKNPPSCSVVCESGCPRFCNCIENYVYEYEGGKCIPPQKCPRACASNGAGASDQGTSAPDQDSFDMYYDSGSDSSASSSSSGGDSAASSSSSGGDGSAASSSSSSATGDRDSASSSAASASQSEPARQPRKPFRMFGPSAQNAMAVQRKKAMKCNRPNEVFDKCGTSCEKTCYTKDEQNSACAQQCKPGCRCRDGFVRNEEGDCIYADNCFNCSQYPNEIWKPCGKNCEPSCEVPNPQICSQQCTPDCRCKKGFVRYLGICVEKNQCPRN